MKRFCSALRMNYLIVLILISLLNESLSKSIQRIFSEQKSNECIAINFDVGAHYDYITDEQRYGLCKNKFKEFDQNSFIKNNKECLSPICNYFSNLNPCAVECAFKGHPPAAMVFPSENDTYRISNSLLDSTELDDFYGDACEKDDVCRDISLDYDYKEYIFITDTNQRCGPKHFCDLNGCCVERSLASQTTIQTSISSPSPTPITSTITTSDTRSTARSSTSRLTTVATSTITTSPSTPSTTEPTTPSTAEPTTPSTAESTTPSTVEPTTSSTNKASTPGTSATLPSSTVRNTISPTSITTLLSPVDTSLCKSVGKFKYPNDKTNRKYVRCVLMAQPMVCPPKQIFDETLSHCVDEMPQTVTAEPTTPTTTPTPTTSQPTTPSPPVTTHTIPTTTTVTDHTTEDPNRIWKKLLHCTGPDEGFFANPYDCTKFYRCVKFEHQRQLSIFFFTCPTDQYFEAKNETCIRTADYVREYGPCKHKDIPTGVSFW